MQCAKPMLSTMVPPSINNAADLRVWP